MLPPPHRLRSARDFADVVRRGRRASRPLLTVHVLAAGADAAADGTAAREPSPPRAGLVISKAVGGSVLRHRTARRLRHLLRDRIGALPAGTRLVVRAAAGAGTAPSAALAADLDGALADLQRRGRQR